MKLLKKIVGGSLLALGFLCLTIAVTELVNPDPTTADKTKASDTVKGGIAFGIPLVAAAGWIFWGLSQQAYKEDSDRLLSIFFKLLQQGNGYITVLQFALEAQLSGVAAKKYLDVKAKEFNATFDVSNEAAVSYHFPGLLTNKTTDTTFNNQSFDLILEHTGSNKIAVIKIIRDLTSLDLKGAKDLVESTPKVFKQGVDYLTAEEIKKQLERLGAKVSIK